MADHDDLINHFCSVTGASPDTATEYLAASGWNMEAAGATFFADQEDDGSDADAAAAGTASSSAAAAAPEYTGPRTLDGRPAPPSAAVPSVPRAQPKKKGIATLGSLGGSSRDPARGHHHDDGGDDDDDDDDDDDNDHGRGNLFAGGEKSGLAVQDPTRTGDSKKLISDIVRQAKSNASRPVASEAPEQNAGPSQSFRGSGQTLGGEGIPSRVIPDPLAEIRATVPSAPRAELQERTLHLWRDGFSVDDGPLHRFDDPAQAADLAMIRAGRAPLHLMNVVYDQPVDVRLEQHEDNWRQLSRPYRPFGGEGRRLGGLVPGEDPASSIEAAVPSATSATVASGAGSGTVEVDDSEPVLTIRIQLPDGTRLPARFNTTHTLGDVYRVVQRASPETASRAWVLATTFPNKEHVDQTGVLGDMAEFKRGGTAVVKWV